MKYDRPLKSILIKTRSHWDRDETRPAVRAVFKKALHCRTSELGAEVYSSENQYLVLYHTCKSRACPSCGYRATIQWLRERWAALPDVLYKGITFTMPDVLWPFFRDSPRLANALPALAAELIQARARAKHDVRVGVMAVVHTFNGKLEFNSHVHAMVTAGGLQVSSDSWIQSIYYDQDSLMEAWRKSVTALLRVAVAGGRIQSDLTSDQTKDLLDHLQNRWWSIKIQSFPNKGHFLKYAGRYVKRPPIAQRRISWIGERTVKFWYTDKKLDCRAYVQCSLEEFVDLWAQHIPEPHRHIVRSFGLFAPRAIQQTRSAIFALLRQKERPRPKPRSWADSIKLFFGRDPLLDDAGGRMKWARRLPPKKTHYIHR